jgi:hypothetical protein
MKVGFALRSTVFSIPTATKIAAVLEESATDSIWFPSVGQAFDALDMCGILLGATSRLQIGTGVIRTTDFDASRLLSRLHTLSEGSGGRFILGVGTGSEIGGQAVSKLVGLADKLHRDYPGDKRPPIFFAALKKRMLAAAYENVEGAILNFCPPSYVKSILPKGTRKKGFRLACYIKLFFAESESTARKMLMSELRMYNDIPQYHTMFQEIGVSEAIGALHPDTPISKDLSRISLANPDDDEIIRMVKEFYQSGVNLPIIYPYIKGDDAYKISIIKRLSAIFDGAVED